MPEKKNGLTLKLDLAAIVIIIGLAANLIGIGAVYGSLNQKVDNLSGRVERLERTLDGLRNDLISRSQVLK